MLRNAENLGFSRHFREARLLIGWNEWLSIAVAPLRNNGRRGDARRRRKPAVSAALERR